jgi:putative oxidoreductase
MEKYLGRFEPQVYALFRIVTGFLFLFHGLQKHFGLFGGGEAPPAGSLLWFAGTIELGAGILVMVGLFAGWAAFLASGTMAVAYFIGHASRAFWPIENQGELAALYAFAFLYIASRGAGPLSLDGAFGRKPAARTRTA